MKKNVWLYVVLGIALVSALVLSFVFDVGHDGSGASSGPSYREIHYGEDALKK